MEMAVFEDILTDDDYTFPTPAEADALIAAVERLTEWKADEAAATNSIEAYWAGSASASVARDYKAGRFHTIRAGR